jgi:metallo-beta-lactamase family protein
MKLTFIGATHEVTGSCFYLEAANKHLLIDCGMEQGPNDFENQEIPVPAGQIDYVLQTHAHIDHSGLLPLLFKNGFKGEVHATNATTDLCNIMLRDSAHIQEFEAEWRNRKGKRAGHEEYVPLYDMDDALGVLDLFVPHAYDKKFSLCEGIEVNYVDVGHLLDQPALRFGSLKTILRRNLFFPVISATWVNPCCVTPITYPMQTL